MSANMVKGQKVIVTIGHCFGGSRILTGVITKVGGRHVEILYTREDGTTTLCDFSRATQRNKAGHVRFSFPEEGQS